MAQYQMEARLTFTALVWVEAESAEAAEAKLRAGEWDGERHTGMPDWEVKGAVEEC
jgi:hypothetical protein